MAGGQSKQATISQSTFRAGFSMLELALVIVVVAIITGAGIQMGGSMLESSRRASTSTKLDAIEAALMSYRLAYNRLPCPADATLAASNVNYGVEAANSGSCVGGTPAANYTATFSMVGGTTVVEGAVPVKALDLPNEYMFDGWGRKITYAVWTPLTAENGFLAYGIQGNCGALTVNDAAGTSRSTAANYVLVSHGPNGHGGYLPAGARMNVGSTNADEQKNCHCNSAASNTPYQGIYVQKDETQNPSVSTDTFDDILRFKERMQLKSTDDWYSPAGTASCGPAGFRFNGNDDLPEMQVGAYGVLAADLNGDSTKDLIILNNGQGDWWVPGEAMIVWGKSDGSFTGSSYDPDNLNGTFGTLITGITRDKGSYFSFGMTTGDLNGDTVDDLVISHGYYSGTGTYVFWGHSGAWPAEIDVWTTPLSGADGVKFLNPINPGGGTGNCHSVAMGDFNDDNIKDLLIGCAMYATSDESGRGYVWFGHTGVWTTNIDLNTANGTNGFKLQISTLPHGGIDDDSYLGAYVAAGDLNGDGIDDVVIDQTSNSGSSVTGSGWVYVIFGHSGAWAATVNPNGLMNGANGVLLDDTYTGFYGGASLVMADYNGDTITDLFIGTPNDNTSSTDVGYIVWGHTGAWAASLDFNTGGAAPAGATKLTGIPSGSNAAWGSGTADVNDDGIADLMISAPTEGASDLGATYVLFGASGAWPASKNVSTAADGTTGFKITGLAAGDQAGYVLGGGDINGDGRDDLFVDAPFTNPNGDTDAGTVYVIYGKSTWAATFDLSVIP